jgi:hypothetical protein
MPKKKIIRHNERLILEDSVKKTPRELFERAVGESHKNDFRTKNVQLDSATGWQLFLLATIPVGFVFVCLALLGLLM